MKPGQKFKRAEKSSLQYKLITGILICSTLLGLFFCAVYFKDMNYMFWLYVIWTLFFALATYCWLDDERYEKFESVMTPVLFGLLGLLAAFAGIGFDKALGLKLFVGTLCGHKTDAEFDSKVSHRGQHVACHKLSV